MKNNTIRHFFVFVLFLFVDLPEFESGTIECKSIVLPVATISPFKTCADKGSRTPVSGMAIQCNEAVIRHPQFVAPTGIEPVSGD